MALKTRLEVYLVANAAHRFDGAHVAHAESLFLEHDTVARLGVGNTTCRSLWVDAFGRGMEFKNINALKEDGYGHLLQPHYIEKLREGRFKESRLHEYIRATPCR